MKKQSLNVLSAVSAVGLLMATAGSSTAQESLTVAFYGGEWGDAIQSCIVEPFTEATGIAVTPEPGVSSVTLAKLKQQKGNPAIDVAWLDGGISELTLDDDLVERIDPQAVPNINQMIPEGVYKDPNGGIYALSTGFYALGLVYNTEEVEEAPTSWWDLWKEDFAGVVTVPSPSNAMGVPFFVAISRLSGGGLDNLEPGVEKMRELEVSSYFDTSGNATNSFQSGEVIAGAHYASAAWSLADKGLPIAYSVPKEGALGGDIRVHIVKGTPKQELAQQFVDFAVGVEPATCMANTLYVGPATKGVELSEKADKRMPWGPKGSVEKLDLIDWIALNEKRDEVTQVWNREVAR